ncbi:unnamed protein product [Closterium sp. Naga37s-1]|nr:unnamed protein product [Closterium sp. Naga37s-1]
MRSRCLAGSRLALGPLPAGLVSYVLRSLLLRPRHAELDWEEEAADLRVRGDDAGFQEEQLPLLLLKLLESLLDTPPDVSAGFLKFGSEGQPRQEVEDSPRPCAVRNFCKSEEGDCHAPQPPPGPLVRVPRVRPVPVARPFLLPVFLAAGFPPLPPPRVRVAASAAPSLLGSDRAPSLGLPPRLPLPRLRWFPLARLHRLAHSPLISALPMTGRRRPPRRDVIVAAASPAVPTPLVAPGRQVPALFRAVADYLSSEAGAAPSASPISPVRAREPIYRSPRGRTHPFLRARGQSFRRRRPPRPPPRVRARPQSLFPAPAAQSQPLQLPPPQSQSASSQRPPPAVPVQSTPSGASPPPPPPSQGMAPSPPAMHNVSAPPPAPPGAPPALAPPSAPVSETPSHPPHPLPHQSPPPPAVPASAPSTVPPPVVPFAYSYPPRLDATAPAPPAPRGLPPPIRPSCMPRRQHPLVPGSRLPAARFGFPGDGAYQSRGMFLSDVGRCVTELSFVLDILHAALQSREVVARDPQLSEEQEGQARRAVSSALYDLLHLPLEPEDPSLDDGPGAAAFRMVATAVEED